MLQPFSEITSLSSEREISALLPKIHPWLYKIYMYQIVQL